MFKASSAEGRLPAGSNLRKQKSLTNLAFLTDAEKKRQLYEPRWSDDMAKGTGSTAVAAGGRGGGGGPRGREAPAMSRSLSRSEHSLLPPRPAGPHWLRGGGAGRCRPHGSALRGAAGALRSRGRRRRRLGFQRGLRGLAHHRVGE